MKAWTPSGIYEAKPWLFTVIGGWMGLEHVKPLTRVRETMAMSCARR